MSPLHFVSILAFFIALVRVSATPYDNLGECVDYVYQIAEDKLCSQQNICQANFCTNEYAGVYSAISEACKYLSLGNGDVDRTIRERCNGIKHTPGTTTGDIPTSTGTPASSPTSPYTPEPTSGSKPSPGIIAGGVIGGVAAIAVIGAAAYHGVFGAIPLLSKLGIVGAGAAGAAGAAASQGASGGAGSGSGGQGSAKGGAPMAQHGAGAASSGLGAGAPYLGDHGQGDAQAPLGADGGNDMSEGQGFSPSSGQSVGPGPAQGHGPSIPGYSADYNGGENMAPSGQSFGPAPAHDPGQGVHPDPGVSAPVGAGNQPFVPDGGTSGSGPNSSPVAPDSSAGQKASAGYAAAASFTPTSFPVSRMSPYGTPSGLSPASPERTRFNPFRRWRNSMADEENQRLAREPHMTAVTTPPTSLPPQPHTVVNYSQPLQPSSTQIDASLRTSIECTDRRAPYARLPSDNIYRKA